MSREKKPVLCALVVFLPAPDFQHNAADNGAAASLCLGEGQLGAQRLLPPGRTHCPCSKTRESDRTKEKKTQQNQQQEENKPTSDF